MNELVISYTWLDKTDDGQPYIVSNHFQVEIEERTSTKAIEQWLKSCPGFVHLDILGGVR